MNIQTGDIDYTIVSVGLENNTIVRATLIYVDNGEVIFYAADYGDPYCGDRSKIILDKMNTDISAEKFKQIQVS